MRPTSQQQQPAPQDNESWDTYRRSVTATQAKLTLEVDKLNTDMLKVKIMAGLIGAVAGALGSMITSVIVGVLVWYIAHNLPSKDLIAEPGRHSITGHISYSIIPPTTD